MASRLPGVQCQHSCPVNVKDGTLACAPMPLPAPTGSHVHKKKHHRRHVDPLRAAFERARKLGWIPFFQEAARANKFTPELLMAIAFRESTFNPIALGADGHGRGLMQIDNRFFKPWVDSGQWKDPRASINKGAEVLKAKQDEIRAGQKKSLNVKDSHSGKTYTFTGKEINEKDLLRVAVAAYNCGLWAYYHYSRGDDIDKGTAKKNYSKDVLKNAERFRALMQAPLKKNHGEHGEHGEFREIEDIYTLSA